LAVGFGAVVRVGFVVGAGPEVWVGLAGGAEKDGGVAPDVVPAVAVELPAGAGTAVRADVVAAVAPGVASVVSAGGRSAAGESSVEPG
jgi:hypothetical protein